jgi:type II secretory pathway pseudopilin PulG
MKNFLYLSRFSVLLLTGLLTCSLVLPSRAAAINPSMDCQGTIDSWILSGYYRPGDCRCVNGKPVCSKSGGKTFNSNQAMKMMVTHTILESLLASIFAPDPATTQEALAAQQKAAALAAAQAAAEQKARAAQAQAEYERMMQSYKQLDGSQGAAFKTLSDSSLALKSLDGDAETLAAGARKPFDTASDLKGPPPPVTVGSATPFFGDTMPIDQIRTLVNPENDPRVVDLRKAVDYVVGNLKNDNPKLEGAIKPYDGVDKGGPIVAPPDCVALAKKLRGFIDQRNKFHKTILLSQEQYTTWETANRNALINAAKDGIDYFSGRLLDFFAEREKSLNRLQKTLEKKAQRMTEEGINVAAIQARIERVRLLSSGSHMAEIASKMKDWTSFMKNGLSALLLELNSSNDEIKELFENPQMQKHFETDSPALSALLDLSMIVADEGIFGKWVKERVPIIAALQFSVDQAYNATDWYLSFTRIMEANRINGEVMFAAQSLQKHIDTTYIELRECR